MARYFLDTEFNEFGGDLISLALVREDGPELYVATVCAEPGPWVSQNVVPIIEVSGALPRWCGPKAFGLWIQEFLADDRAPVIIADWPDDIRYFCQALITGPGQMVNIESLCFQVVRVDAYPTALEGAVQHNALWDARALRHLFGPPPLDAKGNADGQ